MFIVYLLLAVTTVFGLTCRPNEIYIREQAISSYTKRDGTHVSNHPREAHCRKVEPQNYFQDSTTQNFINFKPKIKKWTVYEKEIVQENLALLPAWLSKYHLKEILRGDVGGYPMNPAASVVRTRTLLIFDRFFKGENKRAIIIHEMAHIALPSLDPDEIIDFSRASGWTVNDNFQSVPPQKLLLPDSQNSINEDLANHIEVYHIDPTRLMAFNPITFLAVKKIVESEENNK